GRHLGPGGREGGVRGHDRRGVVAQAAPLLRPGRRGLSHPLLRLRVAQQASTSQRRSGAAPAPRRLPRRPARPRHPGAAARAGGTRPVRRSAAADADVAPDPARHPTRGTRPSCRTPSSAGRPSTPTGDPGSAVAVPARTL
ncbi:MAG: hypothetical protein AVDCRST_MAG57-1420, partial [uncultured Blastococcus sp.]